jgi:hypothetical protein
VEREGRREKMRMTGCSMEPVKRSSLGMEELRTVARHKEDGDGGTEDMDKGIEDTVDEKELTVTP